MSLQLRLATPCIWLETTHTCNPLHYGPWVILYFFLICMCGLCFLPLLLVFAMKCVKMHCCLPHNPYCCSLSSPVHLLHLLICTCFTCSSAHVSTLYPLLAHHHLCDVDVNCVFIYIILFFCCILCFFSLRMCFFFASVATATGL